MNKVKTNDRVLHVLASGDEAVIKLDVVDIVENIVTLQDIKDGSVYFCPLNLIKVSNDKTPHIASRLFPTHSMAEWQHYVCILSDNVSSIRYAVSVIIEHGMSCHVEDDVLPYIQDIKKYVQAIEEETLKRVGKA